MKRFLSILLVLLLSFAFFTGCENNDPEKSASQLISEANPKRELKDPEEKYGTHHAVMTVKNYGVIKLELYGDIAPITVKNFVELCKSGFYNGLTIHQILPEVMMQAGAPKDNEKGHNGTFITGEFALNGYRNDIKHERGVISMARQDSLDSASCLFFIVLEDSDRLNGKYAAFGKVTEGMDIIDKIAKEVKYEDEFIGSIAAADQPIIESIVITD